MILADDKKNCETPTCGDNEFITKDGECKPCERFTVVSRDRQSCIKPRCTKDREFITRDGNCQQCAPYLKPSKDKMSCQTYECEDPKDSIGPDGECHDFEQRHGVLEDEHEALEETH